MTATSFRYFYTPRAALHQMLEHGFTFPGYTERDIRSLIGFGDENILLETDNGSLLEPQGVDLLQIIGGHYHGSVVSGHIPQHMKAKWNGDPSIMPVEYQATRIIQRDGKPFFSPQAIVLA